MNSALRDVGAMERKSQRTIRAVLIRLALLVGAVAISLLLAEVALRLLGTGRRAYRSTLLLTEADAPNYLPDFRDRKYDLDKSEGVFRILVIGDSYPWGSGVHPEDAYPDRLQRRIDRLATERPIEVINWSRPGWNTAHEWRATGERLPRLAPDLIVVSFCLNDVEPGWNRRNELAADAHRRELKSPAARKLARRSVLFKTLYERVENLRQKRAVRAYYPMIFADEAAWSLCLRALGAFRDYAGSEEIPLMLLVFPVFDGQVDEEYPYEDLHRQIDGAAAGMKIAVYDLLPVYRGMDTTRLAVDPFNDPHPNEIAHRIASDKLFDYLVERQWLPLEDRAAAPTTDLLP